MSLYLYFLIASILAGLTVYIRNTVPRYLKLLPIYLALTLIVEIIATWLEETNQSNLVIYSIYYVINFSFYLFIIRSVLESRFIKKVIFIFIVLFELVAIFNIIFVQNIYTWNSFNYSIGSLLVVTFSIYYFFELFKRPKAIKLSKEPSFWICTALLFYYTCSFPLLGLNNFLTSLPDSLIRSLMDILILLNVLLYSLFTIGFLSRVTFKKPVI